MNGHNCTKLATHLIEKGAHPHLPSPHLVLLYRGERVTRYVMINKVSSPGDYQLAVIIVVTESTKNEMPSSKILVLSPLLFQYPHITIDIFDTYLNY